MTDTETKQEYGTCKHGRSWKTDHCDLCCAIPHCGSRKVGECACIELGHDHETGQCERHPAIRGGVCGDCIHWVWNHREVLA